MIVDDPTWHRYCWNGGGPLVSWNFRPMARSDGGLVRIALEAPDARRQWLGEMVAKMPALLGDFAYAAETSVATAASDEAFVGESSTQDGRGKLLGFIGTRDDIHRLHFDLTLTCMSEGLEPMEFVRGAYLSVEIWLDKTGALDVTSEDPVYFHFALNCDIYAPFRKGLNGGKNTTLAALNGPRLAGFLERIERDVPAQLMEMDDDVGYRGMIGPRGFLAPAGTLPGA
jgi:hypothetical protein